MRIARYHKHGRDYNDGEELLIDCLSENFKLESDAVAGMPLLIRMVRALGFPLQDY